MARRCCTSLHMLSFILILSLALCAASEDEQREVNRARREIEDDDPTFFQNGEFGPMDSKWEAAKEDIQEVMDTLPRTGSDQRSTGEMTSDMSRVDRLKRVYQRLLGAEKSKRGLYGRVLGGAGRGGYKMGKREFMPYELMNEYQKRLFGSVLNNFKFGKRVPEELPANYLTGGQIYDNISDNPRQQKRMFGSILRSYKMGKRSPSLLELIANQKVSDEAIECLQRPDCPLVLQNQR